jgi:hypothetical protein
MDRARNWIVVLVGVLLVAAIVLVDQREADTTLPAPPAAPAVVNPASLQIVTGQQVFVPAYSEIALADAENTIDLTVTLAIHNTDLEQAIIIRSVRYYDTSGQLVEEFVQSPVSLAPLATTGFVVPAGTSPGGWGTNFIVEWGAESPVYEPVIEAVIVSRRGTEGISFISPGRVISEISAEE